MARNLTETELKDLEGWLADEGIKMPRIHRDLSDAVGVAELIKKYYPRMVQVQSYPACCNTQLKLYNWETLNDKVLSKLGLLRTKRTLEKLASGTPGTVELLLFDLMQLEEMAKAKQLKEQREFNENSKVVTVTLHKKVDGEYVPVKEKMVRYSIYEQALQAIVSKDKELQDAMQRIDELELVLKHKQGMLRKKSSTKFQH